MRHGIFLAPFHPVDEDPTMALQRDLELCSLLDELGYDGVYWASARAYLENSGPDAFSKIQFRRLRDLRDYRMTTVGESVAEMDAVKQRFMPERWAEFKSDMAYFQKTMGDDYLDSMTDHGANATPVWTLTSSLLDERQ